jgi:hypothetical protein
VNHWLLIDEVRVGPRSEAFRARTVKARRSSTSRSVMGTLCSSEGVFRSRIPAPFAERPDPRVRCAASCGTRSLRTP